MTKSTLFEAAKAGDAKAVSAALATCAVDATDEHGRDALYFAAREGHAHAVSILLEAGAPIDRAVAHDPDLIERRPLTPEQTAWLNERLVQLLGALPDEDDPMLEGLRRGMEAEARTIGASGASTEAPNKYLSPLGIAVRAGHEKIVDVLLAAGADARGGTRSTTAMWYAVHYGHTEIVRRLVEAGADVNGGCDQLRSVPLMVADDAENQALYEVLLALGANEEGMLEHRLYRACEKGDEDAARACLREGAQAGVASPNGRSSLLAAASTGKRELVDLLIDKGAQVTPQVIMNAIRKEHFGLARYFLSDTDVVSCGSKSADRDEIAVAKERSKKAGHQDLWEAFKALELKLGLRKPRKRERRS